MKNLKYIFFGILYFAFYNSFGQHPLTDPHYQLVWNDDFNGTTLDWDLWDIKDWNDGEANDIYTPNWPTALSGPYPSVALADNLIINNGTMKMHFKKETVYCGTSYNAQVHDFFGNSSPNHNNLNEWFCSWQNDHGVPYHFTGAAIELDTDNQHKYGYYEARMKVPFQMGSWAAFWTFRGDGLGSADGNAGEIDIFEILAREAYDGLYTTPNIIKTNVHLSYCPPNSGDDNYAGYCEGTTGSLLCPGIICNDMNININNYTKWHTYGLELTPSKIVWFIDGVIVRSMINPGITCDFLDLRIGIGAEPNNVSPTMENFDVVFETDYIRFYEFIDNKCEDETINQCVFIINTFWNNQISNPIIYESITIGGQNCINNVPANGTPYVIRSHDFVEIQGDFSVPLGAELYIDVNSCY